MCLILVAWQTHSRYPLVVAANRDEFYARPTQTAHFWEEHPDILAGRDLEHGGSWLGVCRNGRFAAVTNLRNVTTEGEHSRGHLVRDFLLSGEPPETFFAQLEAHKTDYRPFNFIASDGRRLLRTDNISTGWQNLEAGYHVVGNLPQAHAYPKAEKGLRDFALIEENHHDYRSLLTFLGDTTVTDNSGDDLQRAISCRFVSSPDYGTRCSTIVQQRRDGTLEMWEQNYRNGRAEESPRYFHVS